MQSESSAPRTKRKHRCTCPYHCQGGKWVSWKTYNRHIRAREAQEYPQGSTSADTRGRKRKRLSLEEQVPDANFNGAVTANIHSDNEMNSPPFLTQSGSPPPASTPPPTFHDDTFEPDITDRPEEPEEQHNPEPSSNARLEDDITDENLLAGLRNPPMEDVEISRITRLCLKVFIALSATSEKTYNQIKAAFKEFDTKIEMLSSFIVKVQTDMCNNSCVAFTGPFSDLDACPKCAAPRYRMHKKKKVAVKRFNTIPLGPQLQAFYRSPQGAEHMKYRQRATQDIMETLRQNDGLVPLYEDIFHGTEYLAALQASRIEPNDIFMMLSIDGAQLYRDKVSDCWFFIWIVLNISPELRYKKKSILIAGTVPGPNKPEIIESFLLPSLRNLRALQ
ncbi:hypothetical protein M378DRAFT_7842 [Amanita muscaria Koide BX008]|uniref:Transposase n=1 Tax=Amanita muscaria (strain Koide BX008) TaxID=946122 RepID=A0A0C2XJB6_AMAMK|nr:hypothetical protein M378DRAFT_7842 [Amanita muscaria Koide BX008]